MLRIHARIAPVRGGAAAETPANAPETARADRHTAGKGRARRRARLTPGDRLLRNSAIACALLLGILALNRVDAPWAKKASEGVQHALTMHIDLDESIGALQFVKGIMPESALVFMNLSGETGLARPVEGALSHRWSNLQPWMMFACEAGAEVRAVDAGTVTAVSPLSGERCGVLVDHGEGVESLYASLSDAAVAVGDAVQRGQALGVSDGSLYFEYRRGGESVDPSAELGLS